MATGKMHEDEVETDASLVSRLLAAQFPHWADLRIEPVRSSGTDNAIYRLGDDMAVRLPRIDWATEQVDKELVGCPPWRRSCRWASPSRWRKGHPARATPGIGRLPVARRRERDDRPHRRSSPSGDGLGRFVATLRGSTPPEGHRRARTTPSAGCRSPMRDAATREAIASLRGMFESAALTEAWTAALHVPAWSGPAVWIHGDLQPGNLLARQGRISAVIDFGCLGVGDPACDLLPAWNSLHRWVSGYFRAALDVDDATWARGRGWALSVALLYIPYYLATDPAGVENAKRVIDEVLTDVALDG